MSKKKLKQKEIEAEQFLASDPPQQWPDTVQQNTLSVTGYSYGTLEGNDLSLDGFEIENTDWIVTAGDGGVSRMKNSEMIEKYED